MSDLCSSCQLQFLERMRLALNLSDIELPPRLLIWLQLHCPLPRLTSCDVGVQADLPHFPREVTDVAVVTDVVRSGRLPFAS